MNNNSNTHATTTTTSSSSQTNVNEETFLTVNGEPFSLILESEEQASVNTKPDTITGELHSLLYAGGDDDLAARPEIVNGELFSSVSLYLREQTWCEFQPFNHLYLCF